MTDTETKPPRIIDDDRQPPKRRRTRPRRRPSTGEVIAALILLLLLVAAAFPELLSTYDPLSTDPASAFTGPSPAHWFGTDENGRDEFTRVVYGARETLLIAAVATAIGVGAAMLLGVAAGLGGSVLDTTVNRFLDVMFALPVLLSALVLITITGPSATSAAIAVGAAIAPGYARIVRGHVIAVRQSEYFDAAIILGHSRWFIIRRHIAPNVLGRSLPLFTLGMGQAVIWASALSFLGVGAAPPSPEWGAMLSAGRPYIATAWWLTVIPGTAIILAALATTVLGQRWQEGSRSR